MSLLKEQHHQAMDLADQAFAARRLGDNGRALALFRQAFQCERRAAEAAAVDSTAEPTRSVLCRSAATLALDCGEVREAERLIALALSGDPPFEIAEELRDLMEQVYARRHSHQGQPGGRSATKGVTKQPTTRKGTAEKARADGEN